MAWRSEAIIAGVTAGKATRTQNNEMPAASGSVLAGPTVEPLSVDNFLIGAY